MTFLLVINNYEDRVAMMHNEQKVQECDATEASLIFFSGAPKKFSP